MTITTVLVLVHMALHALSLQLRERSPKAAEVLKDIDESIVPAPSPAPAPPSPRAGFVPSAAVAMLCLVIGALSFIGGACTPTQQADVRSAADVVADVCKMSPDLQPKAMQEICAVLVIGDGVVDRELAAPSPSAGASVRPLASTLPMVSAAPSASSVPR